MSRLERAFGLAAVILHIATAAWAQSGRELEARKLFKQGLKHYNLAEYDQAIERFKAGYRLSEAPLLLYNIAQAYRLKGPGSCLQAQTFYRSYLAAEPRAKERPSVERHIEELERCARMERASSAPSSAPARQVPRPTPRPVPAPKRAPVRVWPLVTLGAGAATVAAGAILHWRASVKFDELGAECGPGCPRDTWQGWNTATNVSYGLLAAGGVAMGVGLVFVLWRPHVPARRDVSLVPLGSGLCVRGTF